MSNSVQTLLQQLRTELNSNIEPLQARVQRHSDKIDGDFERLERLEERVERHNKKFTTSIEEVKNESINIMTERLEQSEEAMRTLLNGATDANALALRENAEEQSTEHRNLERQMALLRQQVTDASTLEARMQS